MMMRSSKAAAAAAAAADAVQKKNRKKKKKEEDKEAASSQLSTLHHRLYHALSLGIRYRDGKEWKWKCTDIEIQRHLLRAVASFLDAVSPHFSHHPLLKDSVSDMVWALVWILQYKSEAVLNIAVDVVLKLISRIPDSLLQSYLLYLIHPLSSLITFHQLELSKSCAIALNLVLTNVTTTKEKQVGEILIETETTLHILSSITQFSECSLPIEYFQEMVSLLSIILHRWPPSRYSVWNDSKFMKILEGESIKPDLSVKVAVLKLYSSLALCGYGAKKLLENGESFLQMMVPCMGSSYPLSVRVEAVRLARILATNEQFCLKMMRLYSDTIAKAIVDGMSGWTVRLGKIPNDQMSLLVEACHFALTLDWDGEHQDYLWRQGIGRVLVHLLLENFHDEPSQPLLSFQEQLSEAQKGLKANFLLVLRPYVWDILALLATNCREDINMEGHEHYINILVKCACLSFVDSIQKGFQICQSDVADALRNESVSRAVLMMIYSTCEFISGNTRFTLIEILKSTGEEYLKHLLRSLDITSSRNNFGMPDLLQTCNCIVALTCFSGLPQYQSLLVKNGGMKTLLAFLRWCLNNNVSVGRFSLAPHLCSRFRERICCWKHKEVWEGDHILLLYGLWGLAELVYSRSIENKLDIFAAQAIYSENQLISTLQEICSKNFGPGLKWYAGYILSFFGLYGFPCKLGKRIGKALNDNEYADTQLILANGVAMRVHGFILAIRCPLLLPSDKLLLTEEKHCQKTKKEIYLSSHVDNQALAKLLEYVYLGYLQAGEEHVKKLKVLAKHCGLQLLSTMLGRRRPTWGIIFPSYDLRPALGQAGYWFSDIILEAKGIESIVWTCSVCSLSVPHVHAHKVVLWSSCDYLRALFLSGMQESHSETLKVPVGWEALLKLLDWFYFDEVPGPPSGCLWDNMHTEERLKILKPYLELCWLAEFWFLEDIKETTNNVILSCLGCASDLCIKVMKIAADFSLWKLAEAAANILAPLYHQLCHSGELETLDEGLVDMIRAASVCISQEG